MELEKIYNKRAREDDHHYEDHHDCPYKNSAKKQDLKGMKTLDSYIDFKENSDDSSNMKTLDSSLALEVGVFDFPWLKDGVISKSEDYRFEDAFFSSLIYDMNPTNSTDIEFSGKSLCQTSEELLYLPENKSDDNLFRPVPEGDGSEMEGMDCIWSSLLSQPLQQGGVI
ncbi:hypothetical protein I3843_10G081500 [Carya illinoinensis]|uniref:Uncharacterized protein n=1 Tax=Carya illinoinensis TaxID=32201 RepID=A0A8T1PDR8_CARIL|nr:hypothetical protein I3760_10G083200 [Carya illinoinensis]KAG6639217.1 hypothetical protein CIPAW_10G084400 [Carya illinoinensis]KAG7959661.1 hypothetical protein I3843_10G081500 [Carya illinoinensis]